jgi:hypothetical protein
MDQEQQTAIAGTAIAAFALAQASFVALVASGFLPKDQAEGFLRQAVTTNQQSGGASNRAAAMLLDQILKNVASMEVETRH